MCEREILYQHASVCTCVCAKYNVCIRCVSVCEYVFICVCVCVRKLSAQRVCYSRAVDCSICTVGGARGTTTTASGTLCTFLSPREAEPCTAGRTTDRTSTEQTQAGKCLSTISVMTSVLILSALSTQQKVCLKIKMFGKILFCPV